MEDIGERLQDLAQGKSVREIARRCEISDTALRSYLTKGVVPSADKAARLAEYFKVDLEWLVTGKKSGRVAPDTATAPSTPAAVSVPYFRDVYASAGFGNNMDKAGEMVLVTADVLPYLSSSLSVINVAGDSMAPTLMPEEKVVVDTSVKDYIMSGIYVLRWDGCLYIKRLEKEPRGPLHIKSDNPSAFSWQIEPNEETQEDFAILGRVVMKFQNV